MKQNTSYEKSDFSILNKAIHQESIKQEGLNRLTTTIATTYKVAFVVGILLIILILIGIYKLLTHDFTPQVVEKPVIVEKPTLIKPELDYQLLADILTERNLISEATNRSLKSLPQDNPSVEQALELEKQIKRQVNQETIQEDIPAEEKAFIETSFTIFHSSIIPSGESVVTGKRYSPENISKPSYQYCYLRSSKDENAINGSHAVIVIL